MTSLNRQITLASRPVGLPKVSDFQLAYTVLPLPAAGQMLVRSVYLSLDPHMRDGMSAEPSSGGSVAIGEVMPGRAVGVVVESNDASIRAGDTVEGMFGWQEFAVARAVDARKLDPEAAPITTALGVLGMPGLTAYFGLLDVCNPQPGETVVVSGAAGAIGMLAGQIAKIKGCRVVGVSGPDTKVAWLRDELGFDAAITHTGATELGDQLREACPAGIDIFFDNVGGAIGDAVIRLINVRARIAVCGQSARYDLNTPEVGPRWLIQLFVKQARAEGFLVSSYLDRFPEARQQLATWLKAGRLKYREDVAQGLESAPQAFIELLQGRNEGKRLVQLSDLLAGSASSSRNARG
ncbi:MAG: NADP-dependent oxidoreductase [Thermoanaerobaculia bacterium]|nr:NADP-dependent oxidoreductase [Thermoanaerobaculia bacterium]